MRKFVHCAAALLLAGISLSAAAQLTAGTKDTPRATFYAGYSRLNYSAQTVPVNVTAESNGFIVSAAYNYNATFSLVAEYGRYGIDSFDNYVLPANTTMSGYLQTYMAGPKVSFHYGRFSPFAQALFGASSGPVTVTTSGTAVTTPSHGFAMGLGAGLDYKLTKHFSVRPAQAEYVPTFFTNRYTTEGPTAYRFGDGGTDKQLNNYILTGGVVYNF